MTGQSKTTSAHSTVFAAVLAAGRATRFGSTKQAASVNGVPLVRRMFESAVQTCGDRVITVVGHDKAAVLEAMQANGGFVVVNDAYKAGLGTSIAAAARACPPDTDALLLLLADQVQVTAEHLKALVRSWSGAPDEIVATAYAGTEGPPVLMPRDTFGDLRRLSGDSGARALLGDERFTLRRIACEDAAIDIDTVEDLARLQP